MKMDKSKNNKNTVEDQLADFTDNILSGKIGNTDETPLTPDPELQALEKTSLRLKNAFYEDGLSEEAIQRMRNNIVAQWRQKEKKERKPFWKTWMPSGTKWQSQRSRQRLSMAISLSLLIALMLVSIPFLNGNSTDQPATSVQSFNIGLVVVFCGLILLAIWISRRKN
jgi:hypothetical protein